jgi:hypothetical protein
MALCSRKPAALGIPGARARFRFASAPGTRRIAWDSNCVELSGSQLQYTAGKAIVQREYISDKEPGVCLPEESGI